MGAMIAHMEPARNPWWQTEKTPKRGFIAGGVWLFIAAGWLTLAVRNPEPWRWVFAALWALGGVGHTVSAALLRQRQRASQNETGPDEVIRAD
ncbi:hypothetical protein O7634_02325 [Micromonospora sp. WMMD1120]|uniref:hypothetical protein n=1 Tax=Micromonospora sp. WMMD1120 TaxID=3016106 RepID=UPI0024179C55|nr:hypothetical protein [Micromonospora sp. WMMD1120]MDG4805594.1 hypothetical protein [Micromonospora sp. WMMD1120]